MQGQDIHVSWFCKFASTCHILPVEWLWDFAQVSKSLQDRLEGVNSYQLAGKSFPRTSEYAADDEKDGLGGYETGI